MDERAAEVALAAVRAGSSVLADRYGAVDGDLDADFRETDVKAAADVAAEDAMLPVVREAFPEHAIYAEESGTHDGTAAYRWIVDPLDGTNNFAAGLPTFATAVALQRTDGASANPIDEASTSSSSSDGWGGSPVVAAARLPVTGEEYVARRGAGVRYDGERVTATNGRDLSTATVATVIGHPVVSDPDLAARVEERFERVGDACKRRLDTWAPTVAWGLLARGRIGAVVAAHPDREEHVLGECFVRESDAATWHEDDLYVAAASEALLEGVRERLAP